MSTTLSVVVLALGALVLLQTAVAALQARRPLQPPERAFLYVSAAALVVVVLGSLPTSPPWSPGQAFAPAMLLGGGGVLLAGLFGGLLPDHPLSRAASLALPALGVVLLTLWSASILDSLGGFMLVAAGIGLLAIALSPSAAAPTGLAPGAGLAAVAAIAVGTATYLATYHQNPDGVRAWQPFPALLAVAVAAGVAVQALVLPRARGAMALIVPVVVLVAVGALAAFGLGGPRALLPIVAGGAGLGLLLAWLGGAEKDGEAEEAEVAEAAERAPGTLLVPLVILAAGLLAFRELHGFGIAVLAVTLAAGGALCSGGRRDTLLLSVGILTALALYRMYTETYAYRRGFEPDFLYYHVALLLGAAVPAILAAALERGRSHTPASRTAAAACTGAAAMLVPLSIAVLMFDRAQVGFLVGLPIGLALLAANWRPAFQRVNPTGAVLLMSLAGLAAVQFTPLVAALALRPRWERAAVVLVFALLLALAAAVSAWRGRRAGQQKVRPA
jgi:hypothetical protein